MLEALFGPHPIVAGAAWTPDEEWDEEGILDAILSTPVCGQDVV